MKQLSNFYSKMMLDKIEQYNSLRRRAEEWNRNNGGKPTVEEEKLYRDAANICEEIINFNLTNRFTVLKWKKQRDDCIAEIDRISGALDSSKSDVDSVFFPPKVDRIAPLPARELRSVNSVMTNEGLTNKNADRWLSADVIESWFKDRPQHSTADVIGMEEQKQRMMEIAEPPMRNALGFYPIKRVFIYGPSGCGKTFLIDAFAAEMMDKGWKYIRVDGVDIRRSLVCDGVKIAFTEALENEPCILYIDNVECIAGQKNAEITRYEMHLIFTFLQSLDTLIQAQKRVILICETNVPDKVDGAVSSFRVFPMQLRVPTLSFER